MLYFKFFDKLAQPFDFCKAYLSKRKARALLS
jgi:hypothetical protein